MVDVSEKADSVREAVATGCIRMSAECFSLIRQGAVKKGDVLSVARVAGIMGAKKTSELVPLCHVIALTGVQVALLTIYDMCKEVDRGMVMSEISLLKKSGGKSGDGEG